MNQHINAADAAGRIMVALDYPHAEAARQLIKELAGIPCYMKVGMQLFYAAGPAFVRELKDCGYKVFLDVKMHDIPNTVKGGANSVTKLGADMFNVHAAGGASMMRAAMEGVQAALAEDASLQRPVVIAVTQLTSTNQLVMNDEIGIPGAVEEAVVRYAKLTQEAGLAGVVASPQEVTRIKAACGAGFKTVTPGIRPAGSEKGDQSRVMTPGEAFACGTDYIVVGRPITAAPNPRAALESILKELLNS
ncbi:orotidine-5'-phosphate decarboxylase [Paenibacillus apiarius]|uniref:Orotidine 5'-phosphate decarboxylase n=1 Tax=Paenibacillus apiarius TaxID=46240 RepID=A0ABT4DLQ4_9BACL|nr:orotidine-5'-phosphate decarboxylase [Paenibacillus apiarius]MCY9513614.1 orotidine-5'-phosphate decarboxylase [Paenibacillus apiarius]MCY9518165.1 orotidine-5'-phosphate decarboxylase [Paenibacillus apiarius]MCY9551434.1 orotidine-5'-phosphate decarboxylase [Paenibacillus apiarius]MCY9558588.1 orotidine-5'-phosphate decarboxylase [Paenibacillus apiarius]MCY9684098.1 orotidine-5'-phosphate decarboxylase [Paenibacillus apiarius]